MDRCVALRCAWSSATASLRTSASRDGAYEMFRGLGFEDMGVYMEVTSRRIDGSVSTDRRLFLTRPVNAEDSEPVTGDEAVDAATADAVS